MPVDRAASWKRFSQHMEEYPSPGNIGPNVGDKMIPYISITLGQQGGIGYPPVIIKLDRWYAISDSRERRPPEELKRMLQPQQLWRSPYDHRPDKFYHSQSWALKKYHSAPKLIWNDVLGYIKKRQKR